MIFTIDEIHLIHAEAVRAGLHDERSQMLFGITIEYTARLKTADNPADQLLSDLDAMNSDGALADEVPLERWLRNAAYATRLFPPRQKFFGEQAELAGQKARAAAASWIPAALRNIRILPAADQPPTGVAVARGPGLDAALKAQLAILMAEALTADDLDRILLRCFSNARVRTAGPNRQQSMAQIAPQCVELVEREKLTTVFMRYVLALQNCTPELRQTAVSTFPELKTAGQQPFSQIVDTLAGGLASNIRLIAGRVTDKTSVQELAAAVLELKCYKALHEAVHQVKMSPPPEVPDDGDPARERRFRKDLRTYLVLLSTGRIRATDALGELPPDSRVVKSESSWVAKLGDCVAEIDVALKQVDIGAAELALAVTARIVDPLLSQLNDRIFNLSIGLLDRLVETLWAAGGSRRPADDDPIGDVIETMAALRLALLTQVVEHTRWQETDDALFSLEGNFKFGATAAFTKFARQWPQVRAQLKGLSTSDSVRTLALQRMIDDIDHALAEIEKMLEAAPQGQQGYIFSSMMSDPYSALRSGAQEMFFNIDSALKRNCNDLVRIEQPLILITTEIGA